jgi:hypothetical protein
MLGSETVYAHCEAYLLRHGRPCSHSAILHIPMLAERLGWDFDFVQHRSWFIARLALLSLRSAPRLNHPGKHKHIWRRGLARTLVGDWP